VSEAAKTFGKSQYTFHFISLSSNEMERETTREEHRKQNATARDEKGTINDALIKTRQCGCKKSSDEARKTPFDM